MASSHSRQSPITNFFRRHNNNLDSGPKTTDMEFQESDLYLTNNSNSSSIYSSKIQSKVKSRKSAKVVDEISNRSMAVSIPASASSWSTRIRVQQVAESEDDESIRDREAPHEYLARKRGVSLSVYEGVGRTLKGRDMSSVRNDVWKRIGFED